MYKERLRFRFLVLNMVWFWGENIFEISEIYIVLFFAGEFLRWDLVFKYLGYYVVRYSWC